jgi:hypothetical protein
MGKRQRANTIQDSRRLADDGLPWSDLYMYTNKLIIRKLCDKAGDVEYSCGQRGCDASWVVKLDFTTTMNYRRHYKKFHFNIPIDGDPNTTNTSIARRPRTIADFWSSSRPVVSFK